MKRIVRIVLPLFVICVPEIHCKNTPRFISLKSAEVNMRVGPGTEYPISWIFMAPHVPMLFVAEFNQWRKVSFIDGTEGWVHQNMVSRKNTALVTSQNAMLYKYESKNHPVAKIEQNVIVNVLKIKDDWVKIEVHKMRGWMKKQELWGVNSD